MGAGSGRSPIAPFNAAALESNGCDWVTYASPQFDSRHELVQSMTRDTDARQVDWLSQHQVDPDGTNRPRIITFAIVVSASAEEVQL